MDGLSADSTPTTEYRLSSFSNCPWASEALNLNFLPGIMAYKSQLFDLSHLPNSFQVYWVLIGVDFLNFLP